MKDGQKGSKRPKPYSVRKHYSKHALVKAIQAKRSDTLIKDGVIDNKRATGHAAPAVCPPGGGFGLGLRATSLHESTPKLLRGVNPPNPSRGR